MDLTYRYESRNVDFYARDSRFSSASLRCTAHLHYHVEMACIIEGSQKVLIDSNEYIAEAGDITVAFPNQVHSYSPIDSRENYIVLIFNPDILPEFSKQFVNKLPKSNLLKGVLNDKENLNIVKRISEIYSQDHPYKNMMIRGYLMALFGKLFCNMEFSPCNSKDSKTLETILNYCTVNFDKPLTLSMLEKEIHISKFYISHTLSTKLHIGFNDYINSLRISNACQCLLNDELSITEISDKVGFNSIRTFNRAFLKQMGITPSEYRSKKEFLYSFSIT